MIGMPAFLMLSGLLFAIGFLGVLVRRNAIVMLMSLELMLNAVNLAFVAFSYYNRTEDGMMAVFFVIAIAAVEVTVGLALLVALYHKRQTVRIPDLTEQGC